MGSPDNFDRLPPSVAGRERRDTLVVLTVALIALVALMVLTIIYVVAAYDGG